MYLLSRKYGFRILLTFSFASSFIYANAQTDDFSNPRVISGGSRTYNANITGNPKCPNTYEYIPTGYDFNDKTKKYPLIISLPGLSEMIQLGESITDAAMRLAKTNEYENAGVNLKIERNEFPPLTNYQGTDYQFIVVTIQCQKDDGAEFTANLPAAIDDVLSNYLILEKFADKIDLDKIYLTGTSRGGGITLEFMESTARAIKIAGIVPIAPGTPILKFDNVTKEASVDPVHTARFNTIVSNIANTTTLGFYGVHNVVDQSVFISASRFWRDAINAITPGKASLREFVEDPAPMSNHNAWKRGYNPNIFEFNGNTVNIFQWMLSRSSIFASLPITL
ncbi:MAG TPA: alpha/beta hydrolase fold domain-containing protein, partial [Chitinophagaceae bacterium]|nr:alpha/beta hydrolase fold domain-containing protein [Chitinophagaceae bacterium]